jgi:hypothetical protein
MDRLLAAAGRAVQDFKAPICTPRAAWRSASLCSMQPPRFATVSSIANVK